MTDLDKKIEALINGISAESLKDFCSAKADATGGGAEFIPAQTGGIKIKSSNRDIFRRGAHKRFESIEEVGYFKHLEMFVFLVKLGNSQQLSERSCRRLQFDFACDILKSADWEHQHTFTDWLAIKGVSVGKVSEGLFVFADENGNFRFSYIQNVNRANDAVARRFRRYTFYVTIQDGQKNLTFKKRMEKPWNDAKALSDAFSVQALSDEFFDEYKRIYGRFVDFCTTRSAVKKQFSDLGFTDDKCVRDYVKKLMGRLVFLQFLEKKCWLGVPDGGKWGEGDPNYLRKLFNAKKQQKAFKDNFLDKVLEPLFFNSLNENRHDGIADPILSLNAGEKVRIPYLNGGLFEKGTIDETNIPFPDDYFGDLFDTFDRFNFTIDENGPEDAEIGVDPEMLSRIFENLLEDNKDKGAFYTPKEIVDYMCKESLIAYLGETPSVRNLIENYSSNDEIDASLDRQALLKKLADVKICDPAIGSGAFPMGMLAILSRLRLRLEGKEETSANIVALKKDIIQKNIYGVDIEAGAVDIARLRFWLSIVVDEENPIPLPNLDYKIMQGNSLLESYGGVDLSHVLEGGGSAVKTRGKNKGQKKKDYWQAEFTFDAKKAVEEIVKDKYALFDTTDHNVKIQLMKRISENVKAYIADKLGPNSPYADKIPDGPNSEFMLWHLFFAEVFEKGGFDIVIGNPPYFNVETLGANSQYVDAIKLTYPEFWQDKSDILFYFFALGMRLSKNVLMYITSNAYPYSNKARKLRNEIISDGRMRRIINFEKYNIFNSASITTCITEFNNSGCDFVGLNFKGVEEPLKDVIEFISKKENYYKVRLTTDAVFALVTDEISTINAHIDATHKQLNQILVVGSGMQTAANDVYGFQEYPAQFPAKYIKHRVTGTTIKKYFLNDTDPEYLLYVEPVGEFLNLPKSIQSHLNINSEFLRNRAQIKRCKTSVWWKYVFPMHKEYYHLNKIWCSYRAKENIFALDESTDYIGLTNTTVIFDTNPQYQLKYILALLNSKLLNFRYRSIGKQTGGGIYEYFENGVGKLPIPDASKQQQDAFVALIDQVLSAKKQDPNADTSALERQIDDLVYDLYGLTEEERKIVDPERFGTKIAPVVEAAAVVSDNPSSTEDDGDDARS